MPCGKPFTVPASVVIECPSISGTRQTFCLLPLIFYILFLSLQPSLIYSLLKPSKANHSHLSLCHGLFTGFLPLCFWFGLCDVFLDILVPLKLEAKWVDGFVSTGFHFKSGEGECCFKWRCITVLSSVFCILLCTFKISTPAYASYWCYQVFGLFHTLRGRIA